MRRAIHSRVQMTAAVTTLLLVAVTIAGMRPAEAQTFLGLTFPTEIGGAVAGHSIEYEKSMPGFGYSVAYLRPGWKADVYVYNLRSVVPGDPLSAAVKAEFDRSKGELLSLQKKGTYSNVTAKGDFTVLDGGRVRFVCSTFGFVLNQIRQTVDSFLCLTGWNGQFVKFRMTTPRHAGSTAEARQFVEAWFKVLWPTVRTVRISAVLFRS